MRSLQSALMAAIVTALFSSAVPGVSLPAVAQEVYSVEKGVRIETGGGYLGIEMEDVTAENMASYKLTSERGVIVRSVVKDSPAESAGLQGKDVILEYAGMPVFSAQQMTRLVRETPVGRKVDLAVSRDGRKISLTARIEKRGEGPGAAEHEPDMMMFGAPGGRTFRFRMPDGGTWYETPGMMGPLDREQSPRPRLGVILQPLTDQMADFLGVPGRKGVLVTSVVEGSPAVGKLKAGDVITRADNQPIEDLGDLTRIVRGKPEGGKIELKVVRDKKETPVTVDLAGSGTKPKNQGFKL